MIRGTRRPSGRGTGRGGGRSSGGGRGGKGGTSRDTAPGCVVVALVGSALMILSGGVGILVAQAVQR